MGTIVKPLRKSDAAEPTSDKARRIAAGQARAIRLKNIYAEEFAKRGDYSTAEALQNCTETRSLMLCQSCQGHWYTTTRCRKRVCPVCSYNVAQERRKFLHHLCRRLSHPKLITLTMPSWRGNPRDGISHLRESVAKLRRTKFFRGVKGGAYSIEVIPHEEYWHIHIHLICDAPFLPYQHLFSTWRKILNLSHVQVDIRSASSKAAQFYIAKYASKPGHGGVSPSMIVDYHLAIKGLRLFGTFGTWYNTTIEELDNEAPAIVYKTKCPHCGKEGTSFFARDGPFIIGPGIWDIWKETVVKSLPLLIDGSTPF